MNALTVTTDQLMIVVLALVGLYVVGYHRKWIWRIKKTLFHVALLLASATSTGGLIANAFQRNAEETTRLLGMQQEALEEQQEARKAQLQQIRESRITSKTPLPECGDAKQAELPGEWWGLYQTLKNTTYWEAKLLAVESFPANYGVTEVEPLPAIGFNLILKELDVADNNGRTWKHIERAKAALNPYLAPFNEAPVCFAKAELKEKKDEKKDG